MALRYAPQQLLAAQNKLARAEDAVARKDYESARWLAEQARVDATLAHAMADSERLQRAAAEVNRGIDALKQRTDRGAQ